MSSSFQKIVVVLAVCLGLGIYYFQISRGTGPLDTAVAEQLLAKTLRYGGSKTIETVAPDGELANAPTDVLRDFRALNCAMLGSSKGTLPGRYGLQGRTYGGATFHCLFTGNSRSGTLLYFSAFVHQTADPAQKGLYEGRSLTFLRNMETRELMRLSNKAPRRFDQNEQAALWAKLANDEIHVPADKSQKSPLKKAMDKHFQKLMSQ